MADIGLGDIVARIRLDTSGLTQGLQQAQQALAQFQQTVQRSVALPGLTINTSAFQHTLQQAQAALAQFQQTVERSAVVPPLRLDTSQLQQGLTQAQAALVQFQQGVQRSLTVPAFTLNTSALQQSVTQAQTVLTQFQSTVQRTSVATRLTLDVSQLTQGLAQAQQALTQFQQSLQRSLAVPAVQLDTRQLTQGIQQAQAALIQFQQTVERSTLVPPFRLDTSQLQGVLTQAQAALAQFQQQAQRSTLVPPLRLDTSQLQQGLQQAQQALTQFQQQMQRSSAVAPVRLDMSQLLQGLAQAQQALTQFQQTLQRSTMVPPPHLDTSQLIQGLQQAQQALTQLQQTMQRSASVPALTFNTSALEQGLARAQTALAQFQQQIQRTPLVSPFRLDTSQLQQSLTQAQTVLTQFHNTVQRTSVPLRLTLDVSQLTQGVAQAQQALTQLQHTLQRSGVAARVSLDTTPLTQGLQQAQVALAGFQQTLQRSALVVPVRVDVSPLQQGITQAQAMLAQFQQDLQRRALVVPVTLDTVSLQQSVQQAQQAVAQVQRTVEASGASASQAAQNQSQLAQGLGQVGQAAQQAGQAFAQTTQGMQQTAQQTQQAAQGVTQFSQATGQAAQTAQQAGQAAHQAAQGTAQFAQSTQQAAQAQQGMQQQTRQTQQQLSALPFTAIDNAIQQFSRSILSAGNSQQRYQQAISEAQAAMRQFGVTTNDTGQMVDRFGRQLSSGSQESLRQFSAGIREAQGHLNTLKQFGIDAGSGGGGAGGFLSRMLPIAGALGLVNTLAAMATALRNFAVESVQIAGRMEDLTRSFQALEGSAAGAQRTLGLAFSVAQRAGVDFETVATGLRNLEAGARGTVLTSEQVQRAFEGITLGARALGATTDMTGRALVAWEQILTKGRLSAEELVRQLGNAIPGGLAIAAQAFGVTTARLREMAESGLAPVTAAFIGFGEAMRSIGEGAGPIEGITATFARLRNETQQWMTAFGEGIAQLILPPLREMLRISQDIRQVLGIGQAGAGQQAPQTLLGQGTQFLMEAFRAAGGGTVNLGLGQRPPPAQAPTAATAFPVAESRYTEPILRAAQARQIDPGLLSQLIRAESGFRPFEVSGAGAVGLGQLLPGTARQLQPSITREQLFEPQRNIELAAQYLAQQLDAFKDTGDQVRLALTAYHSGPAKVRQLLQEAVRRNLPPTLAGISQIPEAEQGLGPQGRAYAGRVLEAPNVRQLTPEQLGQARTRMTEGWSQDIAEAMDRFAGLQRQVDDAVASGRNFGGMLNKDIRQEADRVLKTFTDILGAMARFPELAAQIPPELRQVVEANARQAAVWREGIMSEERQLELLKQHVEQLEQVKIQQEAVRLAQQQGQADAESYRRQATADLQRQRLEDRPRLAGLTLQQQLAEYEQRAQALRTEVDQTGLRLERMQAEQQLPAIQADMQRIQTLLGRPMSAPEQARQAVAVQGAEATRQLMAMLQTIQQNPAIAQIAPQILAQWEAAFMQLPTFVAQQGQKAFEALDEQMRRHVQQIGESITQIQVRMEGRELSPVLAGLQQNQEQFRQYGVQLQQLREQLEQDRKRATEARQQEIDEELRAIDETIGQIPAKLEAVQVRFLARPERDTLGDINQQLERARAVQDARMGFTAGQLASRNRELMSEEGKEELDRRVALLNAQERLNMYMGLFEDLAGSVGSAWTSALMSIADGTKTVADAFKEMARSILQSMAQIASQEAFRALIRIGFGILGAAFGATPAVGGTASFGAAPAGTGYLSSGGGLSFGSAASASAIGASPFQHGGVVNRPTLGLLGENPAHNPEYVLNRQQMQSIMGHTPGTSRQDNQGISIINVTSKEEGDRQAAQEQARGRQVVLNYIMEDLRQGSGSQVGRLMRISQQ